MSEITSDEVQRVHDGVMEVQLDYGVGHMEARRIIQKRILMEELVDIHAELAGYTGNHEVDLRDLLLRTVTALIEQSKPIY